RTAGMSFAAAAVMSATTFAGSAQFAATSILHTGGGAAAAIAAAVLLNARYAAMSIAVASGFEGGVARALPRAAGSAARRQAARRRGAHGRRIRARASPVHARRRPDRRGERGLSPRLAVPVSTVWIVVLA